MLRRVLRDLSQILLAMGIVFVVAVALGMLVPMQCLASARITVVGKVRVPVSPRVTLALQLAPGLGLTASERREGVSPLNDERQVQVALDGSSFTVEMPRIQYCTMKWAWKPVPPPPAWFVLRFSDVPSERYLVWRHRDRWGYAVTDLEGNEVPEDLATWRIDVGPLQRQGAEAGRNRWLLEIGVERQGPGGAESGSGQSAQGDPAGNQGAARGV
jgi:hypothetical protein